MQKWSCRKNRNLAIRTSALRPKPSPETAEKSAGRGARDISTTLAPRESQFHVTARGSHARQPVRLEFTATLSKNSVRSAAVRRGIYSPRAILDSQRASAVLIHPRCPWAGKGGLQPRCLNMAHPCAPREKVGQTSDAATTITAYGIIRR